MRPPWTVAGRLIAGAGLGFVTGCALWFAFLYAAASVFAGRPLAPGEVQARQYLADPTSAVAIFWFPILAALHGAAAGWPGRGPLAEVPGRALRGCFAFCLFGLMGGDAGAGFFLFLLFVGGVALAGVVCRWMLGGDAVIRHVGPWAVVGAIVGLFALNSALEGFVFRQTAGGDAARVEEPEW